MSEKTGPSRDPGRGPRGATRTCQSWRLPAVASVAGLLCGLASGLLPGTVGWSGVAAPGLGVAVSLFGAFGMVARGTSGNAIGQLRRKIERFEAGRDVDFTTERDDDVGRLYEAVGRLAAVARGGESDRRRDERYRQQLYDVTADTDQTGEEKMERLLELGCERLGLERGYLTTVDEATGTYQVEMAVGSGDVRAGTVTDVSRTVCGDTVASEDVPGVFDTSEAAHPGTAECDVGSYIGGTVQVGDDVRGTVCFASRQPRGEPFTRAEKEFVDLVAGWASHVAERLDGQREREGTAQRLEKYIDGAPIGVAVLDRDGTVTRWNDAMADVFGWTAEEAVGEPYPPVPAGKEAEHESLVERSWSGERLSGVELERERKDGERVSVALWTAPIYDESGDIVEVLSFVSDVTERRERERKLEAFVENTISAIYIKDRDGRYEFVNRAAAEAFGREPEEVVGRTDEELLDGESVDEIRELDAHVLETGESIVEEVVWVFDGAEHVFLDHKFPHRDEDGDTVGVVGISRDITERKERERERRETNERLNAVIEASPDAIVALAPDGTVDLWNPAAERIFGWSAEEVLGEPVPFVPDDLSGEYETYRRRLLDGESLTGVELVRQRKDGTPIDVALSAAPLRDGDGAVTGIVGVLEDVTERKENERELLARQRELEEYRQYTDDLLDAVDDVFYVVNRDLQFQRWNRSLADVTGYSDEEIATMNPLEFVVEEDEAAISGAIEELFETGTARTEARIRRKDGETVPYEFVAARVTNPDGEQVLVGVGRDVSERRTYERELERTRDLLQQAGRVANVGGWELDVTTDPPAMTFSEQLYELHGLPTGTEVDLETAVGFYHPDDRATIRECFERAVEGGESYDVEVRLGTAADSLRWVRAIGEPVLEDGEVVGVRGSIQDVTDRKEYELALQSLHETTRGLLGTETEGGVADRLVETAEDDLAIPCVGLYLLDADANHLEPVASTDRFRHVCEDYGAVSAGTESPLWDCFVSGAPIAYDDDTLARSQLFGESVDGGLAVPLGDHGVFVVARGDGPFGARTRRLVETLVATGEAAFDRIESEETLRERDEELAERNRRLQRQIQITDIIRQVDQSLVAAGSREEIETTVCDRLEASEDVAFAWIGTTAPAGDHLEPRAWAGDRGEYLDAVSFATDASHPEPAVATATREEPTVVSNVLAELKRGTWCQDALSCDFHSVLSVPLAYEEYFYGVLAVYADDPGMFGDLERTVFGELGENIAHSINAVETRRALHADTLVELTLECDPEDDVLGRIASAAGCAVSYEGLASLTDEEARLFVTATGAPPDAVADVLDARVAVNGYRLVADRTDDESADPGAGESLFEVTVTGEALPARLVRHGGSPQSIAATGERVSVVVDVPVASDVREFVAMLRAAFPSVELAGRRTVQRTAHTRHELVSSLLEGLTERQREVFRTAYYAGFFEWPRTSTGEQVAEMLGVTQPTVNRHLRLAQQRLLAQLFEKDSAEPVGNGTGE